MNVTHIDAVYFSPTGGTRRIVLSLADALSKALGVPVRATDLTSPASRQRDYRFPGDSLVVIGTPVYAGRVPNKLLPFLQTGIEGAGATPVIPVCAYGNRSCGEAPRELLLLTEGRGFVPVAAAAMVCRHVFSASLAAGRPDEDDLRQLTRFAREAAARLTGPDVPAPLEYDRAAPLAPYYTPLRADLTPARFLKAKPVTDPRACTGCGLCAAHCPMGSISAADPADVPGVCVKCQACVRLCPTGAKSFADPDFLSHTEMLEGSYAARREPEFFL